MCLAHLTSSTTNMTPSIPLPFTFSHLLWHPYYMSPSYVYTSILSPYTHASYLIHIPPAATSPSFLTPRTPASLVLQSLNG
ncbi:hypothetical protein E2C01_057115 [Portunus trituberculatus]|uniref:Uncharacterized protein n=1 Tax=Portunus trituberculatus TaxID=210409 RepID=A0A5B7GZ64_PORTR|nr:hypothetical protein [Portunus trituberculatus]